jgi:hypothetical protein
MSYWPARYRRRSMSYWARLLRHAVDELLGPPATAGGSDLLRDVTLIAAFGIGA